MPSVRITREKSSDLDEIHRGVEKINSVYNASDNGSDVGLDEGKAIRAEMERARRGGEDTRTEDPTHLFSNETSERTKTPKKGKLLHPKRARSAKEPRGDVTDDESTDGSEFVPSDEESSESEYEVIRRSPQKSKATSKLEVQEPRKRRFNPTITNSRPAFRPNNHHLPKEMREDDSGDESESETGEMVEDDLADDDDENESWSNRPASYLDELASAPDDRQGNNKIPNFQSEEDGSPVPELSWEVLVSGTAEPEDNESDDDSAVSMDSFDREYSSTKSPTPALGLAFASSQGSPGRSQSPLQRKVKEAKSKSKMSNAKWFDQEFPSVKQGGKAKVSLTPQAHSADVDTFGAVIELSD